MVLTFFLILSGCNSKEVKPTHSCSCGDYFPSKQRPSWVDTEGLSNNIYYSHGIAQCSGIKPIDIKESSVNARGNLSRMLETNVQSDILLIRKSNTATQGGGESGRAETSISSEALLNNSSIYAHWVDPDSCTVYSAVKLAKDDLDRTINEAKETENAKLKNQRFFILAEGEYAAELKLAMANALVQNGVSRMVDDIAQADYSIDAEIQSIDIFTEKNLVRVSVFVSIRSVNQQFISLVIIF